MQVKRPPDHSPVLQEGPITVHRARAQLHQLLLLVVETPRRRDELLLPDLELGQAAGLRVIDTLLIKHQAEKPRRWCAENPSKLACSSLLTASVVFLRW